MGGFFMLIGVWIVNNLEMNIGVSQVSYILALIVALIFILIAGLMWINVASGLKHHRM
ncbi:MAG: hypothetical protein ACXABY_15390 [Candidatus Thorarchaeota archaeon]